MMMMSWLLEAACRPLQPMPAPSPPVATQVAYSILKTYTFACFASWFSAPGNSLHNLLSHRDIAEEGAVGQFPLNKHPRLNKHRALSQGRAYAKHMSGVQPFSQPVITV
jgi:hypothetical protein